MHTRARQNHCNLLRIIASHVKFADFLQAKPNVAAHKLRLTYEIYFMYGEHWRGNLGSSCRFGTTINRNRLWNMMIQMRSGGKWGQISNNAVQEISGAMWKTIILRTTSSASLLMPSFFLFFFFVLRVVFLSIYWFHPVHMPMPRTCWTRIANINLWIMLQPLTDPVAVFRWFLVTIFTYSQSLSHTLPCVYVWNTQHTFHNWSLGPFLNSSIFFPKRSPRFLSHKLPHVCVYCVILAKKNNQTSRWAWCMRTS